MSEKIFISGSEFSRESFALAKKIWDSGFRPTIIIGLCRGGYPIAMHIQEYLAKMSGVKPQLVPITVSSYVGQTQNEKIVVSGMESFWQQWAVDDDRVLIVDDIFESGRSIEAVFEQIKQRTMQESKSSQLGIRPLSPKIATMFVKQNKSKTFLYPNFLMSSTDQWIVFPHELEDLTEQETNKHLGFPALIEQK